MKGPSPRREEDESESDWTPSRRQVQGDEVQIGVGKYNVTLRGGIVIMVIIGIAILGLNALAIQKQQEAQLRMELEHRNLGEMLNKTVRLQTCVLSMTPDERLQWRASRDAQNALIMFCPGLLLGAL